MGRLRLVVLGTMAGNPYAGMAWTHMQIAVGLQRLGHDVYYVEATSTWPYDPVRVSMVADTEYAVPYLERVADYFGLGGRWAYRKSFGDKSWVGLPGSEAEELLARSDAVLSVGGATRVRDEGLEVGRLVYVGTDPVLHEVRYADGDPDARAHVDQHHDVVTYGENIGTEHSPVPPLPRLRARTRQPVLLDLWENGPPVNDAYTTVLNFRQRKKDVRFRGQTYYWSKDRELFRFVDVGSRGPRPLELALGLSKLHPPHRRRLEENGWRLVDAHTFTLHPEPYRRYVLGSRGEFTVAKDQNVRLRTGWFSERSACYLAAGRPVVTQDTGFGTVLPVGEGLFAFSTADEAVAALEEIEADYERHCKAARQIAEEYFRAETVLARLLADLGF